MFFHIDESGNTGMNLFDTSQPRLSYGVLSSALNVDLLGKGVHRRMTTRLGVPVLHANEMGVGGMVKIADQLRALQKKFRFSFDYYYIDKPTYALVLLFDAVFDAGLNKAVKWDLYWTPLRFAAIHFLTQLVDEELLKKAWALCITKKDKVNQERIVDLLSDLKARTIRSDLQPRVKELFIDAFEFGTRNPLALDFGIFDKKLVSPNAVGYQFVVRAIARRSRRRRWRGRTSIKIDRQQEFNNAQIETHYNLTRIAEGLEKAGVAVREAYSFHPMFRDLDAKHVQLRDLPIEAPEVKSSERSIGLQIVDLYLWITNRMAKGDQLPADLLRVARMFLRNGVFDSISLEGMAQRLQDFEKQLPAYEDLTDEQLDFAKADIDRHREKVVELLASN
ncbi:MAG: hypothetical protein F4Y31_05405 [Gammaproteobacteria bacterium]|nr:hypothetical protein [Gammaproteobacteria bacterium]MYF66237.1 hypothetical protein [Gammaproteobacteria bacterium]MYK38244.1 hypothetical protein [Gammaproteobacteria bacterium]